MASVKIAGPAVKPLSPYPPQHAKTACRGPRLASEPDSGGGPWQFTLLLTEKAGKHEVMFNMRVAGVGSCVPQTGTSNAEIEERLGLEPGWIEKRTGIRSRPIAGENVVTSDLATDAGKSAMRAAGVKPSEIGLLLLATSTPDHLLPPTAPLVAHHLSLTNAGAIDLTGACFSLRLSLTRVTWSCNPALRTASTARFR